MCVGDFQKLKKRKRPMVNRAELHNNRKCLKSSQSSRYCVVSAAANYDVLAEKAYASSRDYISQRMALATVVRFVISETFWR